MQYPKYPYIDYEMASEKIPVAFLAQEQKVQPGIESIMEPRPIFDNPNYRGSGKLKNKTALITGGDSGIGRAVAILYAKEGADIAIVYLNEREDAEETKRLIEELGRNCFLIEGDLRNESFCNDVVSKAISSLGQISIIVNNAAIQYPKDSILAISSEQLENTFKTNFFSYFYIIKAALPHLKASTSIINTASVTAFMGNKQLIDYSASKGAIVSFTRSLALSLVDQEIRVNCVAPGPVWTPLIPASFSSTQVKNFGTSNPMKRAAQPFELAPIYVFLAADDSRYVTGATFHINGGQYISS